MQCNRNLFKLQSPPHRLVTWKSITFTRVARRYSKQVTSTVSTTITASHQITTNQNYRHQVSRMTGTSDQNRLELLEHAETASHLAETKQGSGKQNDETARH